LWGLVAVLDLDLLQPFRVPLGICREVKQLRSEVD
jgi:hypothetical protein